MTNKHSLVSAAAQGRMSNKDVGIMYAFVLDMPEAGNRERREKYTNAGNRKEAIGTFTGSKAKTSRGEVQLQTPRSALLGLFVRITISFNNLTLSLTDYVFYYFLAISSSSFCCSSSFVSWESRVRDASTSWMVRRLLAAGGNDLLSSKNILTVSDTSPLKGKTKQKQTRCQEPVILRSC